jgi:hypothetical protein
MIPLSPRSRRRDIVAKSPQSTKSGSGPNSSSNLSSSQSGSGVSAQEKSSNTSGMFKSSSSRGDGSSGIGGTTKNSSNSSRSPRTSSSHVSEIAVMTMASRNSSGTTTHSSSSVNGSGVGVGTGSNSNSSPLRQQPMSPRSRMRKSRLQLEASKRALSMRRHPSSPSTASAYAKSGGGGGRQRISDRSRDGGQAAADALRHDLEKMGYNLECESFITRNSSTTSAECDERYAGRDIMAVGSTIPSTCFESSSDSEESDEEEDSETLSQIAYLLDSSSSEEEIEFSSSEEEESEIESTQPKRNRFRLFGPRKNRHASVAKSHESPSLTESSATEDTQQGSGQAVEDKEIPERKGSRAQRKKEALVKKKKQQTARIQRRHSSTAESVDTDPVKVVSKGINTSFKSHQKSKHQVSVTKEPSPKEEEKERMSASSTSEETASVEAPNDNEDSGSKLAPKATDPSISKARSAASSNGRTNTPSKILSSPAHNAQAEVFKRTEAEAVASNDHDDGGSWNAGESSKKKPSPDDAEQEEGNKEEEEEALNPALAKIAKDDSIVSNKPDHIAVIRSPEWGWPKGTKTTDPRRIKPKPSDGQHSPNKITSVPSGQGFSLASLSTDEGVEKVFIDGMSVVYEVGVQSVSPDYIIDGNAADDEWEAAKHGDARLPAHQQVLGTRLGSPMQEHPIARKKSVRIKTPESVEHLQTVTEEEDATRDVGDIEPWLEIDKISGKPIVRDPSSVMKPSSFANKAAMADMAPVVYVGTVSPQNGISPKETPRHMLKPPLRLPMRQNKSRSWNKSPQRAARTLDSKKGRFGALIGNLFKKGVPMDLTQHSRNGGTVAIRLIEDADGGIDLTLLPSKHERSVAPTKLHVELKAKPPVQTTVAQKPGPKDSQLPTISPAASSFRSRSEGQSEAEASNVLQATSTQVSEFDLTYDALKKFGQSQMDSCPRVPSLTEAVHALRVGCESGLPRLPRPLAAPRNKRIMNKTKAAYTRSTAALATSLCPDHFQASNDLTTQILYKTSDDRSFTGSLNADVVKPPQPRRKLLAGMGQPKTASLEKDQLGQTAETIVIDPFSPTSRPRPVLNPPVNVGKEEVGGAVVSTQKQRLAAGMAATRPHTPTPKPKVGGSYSAKNAFSNDASEITMDTITKLFAAGSDLSQKGEGEGPQDNKKKSSGETTMDKMQEISRRGLKGLFSVGAVPDRTTSAPAVIYNRTTKQTNATEGIDTNIHHGTAPKRKKLVLEDPKENNNATNIAKPPTKLPSSLRQPRHSVPMTTAKTVATTPLTVNVAENKKEARSTFASPTGHVFKKQETKPEPVAPPIQETPLSQQSDMAMAYPIEFNDDNCTLNSPPAVAVASPPRAISMETIDNAAQLKKIMASTAATRSSISPVVERGRSEKRSGSPEDVMADLLSSPQPTQNHRRLIPRESPLADLISEESWVEVNEAASLLSRAMTVIDSVKSEDTVNDAQHLHKLLSEERDLSGVEDALHTLKKHADRMGLRESDLLIAAVRSEETGGSVLSATTGQISARSMTLGEELTEMFNFFMGRSSTTKINRKTSSFMLP